MSAAGGGAIILRLHAQNQAEAFSSNSKGLTLRNNGTGDVALSQADIDALATQYCADPYTSVGLAWSGTAWSVTAGPSE